MVPSPLTSPIKLKQPGEATSQCAQQRFSKLPADGRDVGPLGTTRYYKNGESESMMASENHVEIDQHLFVGARLGVSNFTHVTSEK